MKLFCKDIQLAVASRRPEYWQELGRGWAARGRYTGALACHDRALAVRDDIPQGWADRGKTLKGLDRLCEAEASLRQALRLRPEFAEAHCELGFMLDYLGRFEEAEASQRTALRLQPENAVAHFRLGRTLCRLGRAAEAQASFRAVPRGRPEIPEWGWGLGLAPLMAGPLEEGWREFEGRWQSGLMVPPFWGPCWRGEAIGSRAILLVADQGLGDALKFCRYIPQVAARAGRTIISVQPPLRRLLSRLPAVSEVIADGSQSPCADLPPSADLWCAFMSLPHAVGPTREGISPPPYLTAGPADVGRWRERQKGPPAAEAAHPPPGMELYDVTADLRDFADTAALIENLDLVISVDTSVAHLAGALDKPVWVLNRFDTDWRWPRDRDDSPWYPSARQFRQLVPGDWQSVILRTRDALDKLAAGDHGQLRGAAPVDMGRVQQDA